MHFFFFANEVTKVVMNSQSKRMIIDQQYMLFSAQHLTSM